MLGALVLAVSGCGGGETKTVTETQTVTETNAAPTSPRGSESSEAPARVGTAQLVMQDDSQGHGGQLERVRLLAVKDPRPPECDADGINCVKAKRGNRLVAVQVSVTGLDGDIEECGGNSGTIFDPDGNQADPTNFDPYLGHEFACEKKRRNQPVAGWITYEIDKKARNLIFAWRPANGNSANDVQWKLPK